jgi:hypothetical protein
MMVHPILINRPIVVSPKGVKLCRPAEKVLELLPRPKQYGQTADPETSSPANPKS